MLGFNRTKEPKLPTSYTHTHTSSSKAAHPTNPLARLPPWLSRWLGYRAPPSPPPTAPSNSTPRAAERKRKIVVWAWSFIGAFCGMSVLQAVFGHARYFVERGVPSIVPSYGASAVLIYGAIDAPLAQPRALVAGHFLSALIGVCIAKLFGLLPSAARFAQLEWLAGALACACAVVGMQVTGTTHPPAGATALLAAIDADIRHLGWYYLPVILLSSTLALAVALITNNIQRRYPVFWFSPPVPASASASAPGPVSNPRPRPPSAPSTGPPSHSLPLPRSPGSSSSPGAVPGNLNGDTNEKDRQTESRDKPPPV